MALDLQLDLQPDDDKKLDLKLDLQEDEEDKKSSKKPSKFKAESKKVEEHFQNKVQDYREHPWDAVFDTLSLDLPLGLMEQIPAGIQAGVTTGARAAGGLIGSLSSDSTAAQKGEEYANAVSQFGPIQALTPTTKSGVGIAGGIGAAIESFKEHAPDTAEALIGAVPFVGKEWETAPGMAPIRGAMSAAAQAAPDIAMVKAMPSIGKSMDAVGAYRNLKDNKAKTAAQNTVEELKAKQAEEAAAANKSKPYEPPLDIREETGMAPDPMRNGIPETRTNMMEGNLANRDLLEGARERERALAQRRAEVEQRTAAEQQAAREHALELYNKELQSRLAEINEKLNKGEDVQALVDKYNAQYADFQRAKRQAEMELDVKKQTSLDFNAAERARQERAPVPGLEELKARQAEELQAVQEQGRRLQEQRQREEITAQQFQLELTDLDHKIRQLTAQHAIERRQAEMQQQVQRQASLSLNAAERGRQEAAPVPGVESVLERARQTAEVDPNVQAQEAKTTGVEERAVNAGDQGPLHQKFMEETMKVQERKVESLKAEIEDTVRKNPTNAPTNRPIRVKGLGQRGAVGNLRPNKNAQGLLDKLIEKYRKEHPEGSNFIPRDPDPKKTIEEARGQKDANILNLTESGSTMAAAKTGNAVIRDGGRILQNASKRADLDIKENVLPVESAMRKLSREQITLLTEIIKEENLSGQRFSPEVLATKLNGEQIAAYSHLRHMLDDTLRIQNEMRQLDGKPPIDGLEAYVSHRWDGDLRRPIYEAVLNKDGSPKINERGEVERKLVYYLADYTKKGLDKQWAELQKQRPDLLHDPAMDHRVRHFRSATDLESAYTTIIDLLGRDDPAVQIIKQAVEDQKVNEASKYLSQEKHFKDQTGVRGFVGDRPGRENTFNESLAMIQQQIQYAKNAYKWSHMQQAAQGLKVILADSEVVKSQPKAISYVKELYKNYLGLNEARWVAQATDGLRDLGFPTHVVGNALGNAKTFFLLQKLAVNAGYTIAGVLQTANTLPYMAVLNSQGFRGNPLTAAAVGVAGGTALALGHYADFLADRKLSKGVDANSVFWKKAFKYAEDNGVTARSLMDESPISSSFSKVGMAANALGKTMVAPEVAGRSIAFMTYVEYLRSTGKFKGRELELFQKAEEAVNISMVDYRAAERPMLFSKLGGIGNFMNTLQTYPINWYNQWNLFGREAMKGNMGPVAVAFATQYAMAGAMGIPGFSDLDKLYQLVKDHLVDAGTYAKMRGHEFWNDPKVWMMKHFGHAQAINWLADKTGIDYHVEPKMGEGVYGPLSARNPLNIGMTSRLTAPGGEEMIQAPFGPAIDIGKQVIQAVDAVTSPTNRDKRAQVAMSSIPTGLQGALEQAPFMEGMTFDTRRNERTQQPERVYGRPGNVEDHRGIVTRDDYETKLRNFGLRSFRETVDRDVNYRLDKDQRVGAKKANSLIESIYAASKRNDKEQLRELASAYVKLTGKELSQEAWDAQVEQNFLTSMERAGKRTDRMSPNDIQAYSRMKAVMDGVRDDYERRRSK